MSLQLDAAVDCYGAFVTGEAREGTTMVPIVDKTPTLSCPLLGLFGNDDKASAMLTYIPLMSSVPLPILFSTPRFWKSLVPL